jgi:hypothetical protein
LADSYDAAAMADDANGQELASRALAKRREAMQRANTRLEALESALATADEGLEGDGAALAMARLWRSLGGGLEAAAGDVKAMNAVLRETFEAFELHRDADELRIVPVLNEHAVAQALRDPSSPYRVTATLIGDAAQGADLLTMLSLTGADDFRPSRMAQAIVGADGRIDSHVVHELSAGPAMKVVREALAELAERGQRDPRVSITGAAPTLSDKQRPSHLLHNTRPGSWRGTAGGSPRRSRRGEPGSGGRSRS